MEAFSVESYYSLLKTNRLGRPCIYLDQVETTIDVAKNAEPNAIVVAKEQTKGRGQRTNVWQSPTGCAMASLRMMCQKISPIGSRLCFLQHILVLMASKTLERIDANKLGKNCIKLKWPNDIIYVNPENKTSSKIGGVLAHATEKNDHYDIILSFGLNVFNKVPTTCLSEILGYNENDTIKSRISVESIIASILNDLEQCTNDLSDDKFRQLKEDYNERCIQIDKLINDEINGTVKIREVNNDGFLVAERCLDKKICVVTKII